MQKDVSQHLSDIPFADMLRSMARGVAEAQFEVDKTSAMVALAMSGKYQMDTDETGEPIIVERDNRFPFAGTRLSLLELGFTPTFYQFVDTVMEIKVSISITEEHSFTQQRTETDTKKSTRTEGGFLGIGGTRKTTSHTTTVSSQFSSQFQYNAEGSSLVRTRLAPVPPPDTLNKLVQELNAAGRISS